jgi:hypothetical protein
LTTWIEFLNSEYALYDRYTNTVKRLQQQHDEAWNKLVNSENLRPMETKESLSDVRIGLQLKTEEVEAQRSVETGNINRSVGRKGFTRCIICWPFRTKSLTGGSEAICSQIQAGGGNENTQTDQ